MSILVVCPGCRKSFNVSDKFAGKSGACPNCKGKITVPTLKEQVEVHAPTKFAEGGRTTSGKLVTKPIAREQTRLTPVLAISIGVGTLAAVLAAWLGGEMLRESMLFRAIGLVAISPLLVVSAYSFLRDDELEPHQGKSLYLRAAICSLSYVALWGFYSIISGAMLTGEIWEWLFVLPPFLAIGALIALACLDLDYGSGFFHYAFYVLVTVLLGSIAGLRWVTEATTRAM